MKRFISILLLAIMLLSSTSCSIGIDLSTAQSTEKPVGQIDKNQSIANEVFESAEEYENENGEVSADNAQKAIDAVYERALNTPEVVSCKKDESGVLIEMKEGLDFVYCPRIEGTLSGGEDLRIVTLSPDNSSFSEYPDLNMAGVDNILYDFASNNNDWSFKTDSNLDDDEVTLERILSLDQYKFIYWVGHGGCILGSFYICTNIRYTDDMIEKYHITKEEAFGTKFGFLWLRTEFFRRRFEDGAFENAIIYLNNCCSGKYTNMANAFLEKGAAAVIANSNTVWSSYANDVAELITDVFFFGSSGKLTREKLAEKQMNLEGPISLGEALAIAKACYGEHDEIMHSVSRPLPTPSEVLIIGRDDASQLTYPAWMNQFSNASNMCPVDGTYSGILDWSLNNCFRDGRDHICIDVNILNESPDQVMMNGSSRLYVESKYLIDEDEPIPVSWSIIDANVIEEDGRYIVYGTNAYTGEQESFDWNENWFYSVKNIDLPFARDAIIIDEAFCLDYLYDRSLSPNTLTWDELGEYYRTYDCYNGWITVTIKNSSISSLKFEYSP